MTDKIEQLLLEFDKGTDKGRFYKTFYKEVFEIDYEPNCFECEKTT